MDHVGILKRAFNITRRYRALWVFGVLLALVSSSGGGNVSVPGGRSDFPGTVPQGFTLQNPSPGAIATVAIVCRSPEEAVPLERNLRRGLATRLALDGAFDFQPGISVTCVAEVKGLEFDYVVVPDASAAHYPDTPESRRALYVAVTRAIHQLWLASVGTWSPILP